MLSRSLFYSLSLHLFLCLCVCVSLTLSIHLSISVSLSHTLSFSLPLHHTFSISFHLYIHLSFNYLCCTFALSTTLLFSLWLFHCCSLCLPSYFLIFLCTVLLSVLNSIHDNIFHQILTLQYQRWRLSSQFSSCGPWPYIPVLCLSNCYLLQYYRI